MAARNVMDEVPVFITGAEARKQHDRWLKPDQAIAIYSSQLPNKTLASLYNVSIDVVQRIKTKRHYKRYLPS